jgi:hypothetical protein
MVANNLDPLSVLTTEFLDFLIQCSMYKFNNPNPSIRNLFSGKNAHAEVPKSVGKMISDGKWCLLNILLIKV